MRRDPLATFFTLRQQLTKRDGRPNLALADFVAPEGSRTGLSRRLHRSPRARGKKNLPNASPRPNDDYRSILVKALADRIAEALAERMHERVRKEFWAYAPDEHLSTPKN